MDKMVKPHAFSKCLRLNYFWHFQNIFEICLENFQEFSKLVYKNIFEAYLKNFRRKCPPQLEMQQI